MKFCVFSSRWSQSVYTWQQRVPLCNGGSEYLQFIGTELLLNTWSSGVFTHCKRLFDHHGIPDELTTENHAVIHK